MTDAEKPELRRANDNPWYSLATLYGEQPAQGIIDRELAAKNRVAWNRWIAAGLSDEQRADLMKNGYSEAELAPLSPAEKSTFCNAFASRTGRENDLPPDPTEPIDFTNTHFKIGVIFDGFLCAGSADFSSAMFSKYAGFSSATFSGSARFSSATFSGYAHFRSATFSGWADFKSATFLSFAGFRSATFSGNADFSWATFSATFSSTTISGGARPSATATFSSATFSGSATFSSATFSGLADFINAEFTARTVFAHVRFGTNVPDFRGAKMHEATEWHGVTWPPPPRDRDAAQNHVYAYERLKQEMERLKKYEDEQLFFRKELRARRELLSPGAWILNYVYEASSDYGQSIERPIIWLFVLFVSGSIFFAGTPVSNGTLMAFQGAAGRSFANIFSFLPIAREFMTPDMVAGLSSAAKIIGVAQSVLGTLLLFLLGLALRTRFRMR